MKKIYLISIAYMAILFFSLIPARTHAQVYAKDYLFTPLSGTFTELIGGTAFTAVQSDDILVTTPINLGFNFNFCGTVYNTIRAGSNGIMCFSATSSNTAANATSSFGSIKPGLMWLWDDLDGATGTATYATTGTAPNRVFTFQYKNWEWFWNATGPNITVQVKLFETTNIIEYHYRQESQPGTPNSASIGIVDHYATPTYLSLNNSGATPTASSTTFTTSIAARPTNGQIYRFAPPPDCSNSILPTAGTTAASPVNICNNWNTNLTFTPNTAMPNVGGITYRWQTATNVAGPWTNIPGAVTTVPSYTTGALTANAYFRTEVLCNNSVVITSTPSAQVVIATFTSPTVTNGVRCGSGTVNLSASSPGNIIRWYQNATGGVSIQTGNNYTTPIIAANTNYYVTAGNTGSIDSLVLGAGALVTASGDYTTIFSGGWGGYKHQFLLTQAELAAIGIFPGNIINSIGVTSTNGGTTYNGLTVSLLPTTATALNTTFEVGATAVYGPVNYTTTTGLNNFVLTTGYTYTGGNLIIQTCWSNNTASNPYTFLQFDNTSFASTHYNYADYQTPAYLCDLASGGATVTKRPKFTFKVNRFCETPRVLVTATVTPPPAITTNVKSIVCNNAISPIAVTSNLSNYTSYTWQALTSVNLFTDAAAANTYVANTNTSNIYFRSTVAGQHKIVLTSFNSSSGCNSYDTLNIWVQPANITLTTTVDTLCTPGGTSTMILSPATNYAPNSIVWETSTDGINYTVLTGVTGTSYTTPFIAVNTTRHYRVSIKNSDGNCVVLHKQFVVSDPTIIATHDSFNCGPGTVQLSVQTGGFAEVTWYNQATGGTSIGTGDTFITPFLNNTQTFYAAAKGGGLQAGTTTVGTGTLTGSGYQSPFYHLYGGQKNQFLIKASDIAAQGIPAGSYITSLAVEVVANTFTYNDFTLQLANTNLAALNTNSWVGGLTQVTNTASHTVTPGWNTFTFTAPFFWDGNNLVVQTCYNNNNYGSTSTAVTYASTNYTSTIYQRQDAVTTPTICGNATVYGSLTTLPNFRFGYYKSCESARVPVIAEIREVPVVDLGPDITKCVDPGHLEFLDAGNPGSTYEWDNNYTGQVRVVNSSGAYFVTVTNAGGCIDSDTINVFMKNNPVSALGNDTTVCIGQSLTLNAGNDGINYYWNTGATSNSIIANTGGLYTVQIVGSNGCVKTDSIEIIQNGNQPAFTNIQAQNLAPYTFKLSALNPTNVIGYKWDFGDGTPFNYQNAPTHTYAAVGNYVVTLWVSSSCGFVYDTLSVHIHSTGIENILTDDQIKLFPNPTTNIVKVETDEDNLIEKIIVFDLLGRQFITENYTDKNNMRQIDLSKYADGMYQLQIQTSKGTIHKKVEKISR